MEAKSKELIERARELSGKATPGQWHVVFTDDDSSMSAVYVGTSYRGEGHDNTRGFVGHERAAEIVACTLHQLAPVIDHESGKWDENAAFIAASRTLVPELADALERAEERIAELETKRPQWVGAEQVLEQGWWHWWNGDRDIAPIPVSILWSGSDDRFFASIGQLGWTKPQYVTDMGGWWRLIPTPQLPTEERDEAPRAELEAKAEVRKPDFDSAEDIHEVLADARRFRWLKRDAGSIVVHDGEGKLRLALEGSQEELEQQIDEAMKEECGE